MLVKVWSGSGPNETANSFKYCWMFFVLQKIEVCYLLLNCWFFLNELDVIVIVINRRLFGENVLSLLLFFRFCGGIKRISALTYDYFSSVVVLLLSIRPIDHAGGVCMSPILLYRENWVRIVLFIETGWCCWLVSSLFAEIYLHGLLSCL